MLHYVIRNKECHVAPLSKQNIEIVKRDNPDAVITMSAASMYSVFPDYYLNSDYLHFKATEKAVHTFDYTLDVNNRYYSLYNEQTYIATDFSNNTYSFIILNNELEGLNISTSLLGRDYHLKYLSQETSFMETFIENAEPGWLARLKEEYEDFAVQVDAQKEKYRLPHLQSEDAYHSLCAERKRFLFIQMASHSYSPIVFLNYVRSLDVSDWLTLTEETFIKEVNRRSRRYEKENKRRELSTKKNA